MPQQPGATHETCTIGQLCTGADWACANGDLSALRDVARRLAKYHLAEPMHCALIALADRCWSDPEHASALWPALKKQLVLSSRS